MIKKLNSCLIVSYGPVPTPQYKKIEGGGMRTFGLASGLLANGVDVTIAVNDAFPQEIDEVSGIKIKNWSPNEKFKQLLNSFDSVIINYSMGSDAVFVADNIGRNTQLILDCYVPIYVEVSARKSKNIENELINYVSDLDRWNYVLRRGDYFLCANESQKSYYVGALGALGILNPYSYDKDRLLIVPFGIHQESPKSSLNPYTDLGIKQNDLVFLWFGGLYPWFKVDEYLESILKVLKNCPAAKFVFVGGKNPFNPNPDFSKQYDRALAFSDKHILTNKSVFFVDWVDYDDRVNWYKNANVVISFNQPGEENTFSWRTRVMDYLWGEVVTVTNGGDPLGDELINNNAAFAINNLDSDTVTKELVNIYNNPGSIDKKLTNLRSLRDKYFWEKITTDLKSRINNKQLPYAQELTFRARLGLNPIFYRAMTSENSRHAVKSSRLNKLYSQPLRIYHIAKSKGVRRSLSLVKSTVKSKASNTINKTNKIVLISNPIDNSGAPMVLLDIIDELSKKGLITKTRLFTNYTTSNNLYLLKQYGLTPIKTAFGMGLRIVGLQLSLRKDDVVLLNTVAIYPNYRDYVLNLLFANKLARAHWFIHEDIEQTKLISPELFSDEYIAKVNNLVTSGKLRILVPSSRVAKDYEKLFDLPDGKIKVIALHVDIQDLVPKDKKIKDFDEIRFYMSGNSSDGRKGQLLAISAFQKFIDKYQSLKPNKYRDFSVHFVSIGENDYVSTQIKLIGNSILGKRLHIHPSLPRDKALNVAEKCNAVMCCSLNETFGLYIAEGMMFGHIVLRNKSAGFEEQLKESKNGYFLDISDIEQMAGVIEKILNKDSNSNELLLEMSNESKKIAKKYSKNRYLDQLDLFI